MYCDYVYIHTYECLCVLCVIYGRDPWLAASMRGAKRFELTMVRPAPAATHFRYLPTTLCVWSIVFCSMCEQIATVTECDWSFSETNVAPKQLNS